MSIFRIWIGITVLVLFISLIIGILGIIRYFISRKGHSANNNTYNKSPKNFSSNTHSNVQPDIHSKVKTDYIPSQSEINDEYIQVTHNNMHDVYRDDGKLGEYLIYVELRDIPGIRRFLFNAYIPNERGGTTEIDVIMIHETGIYVFESKNYSGWIFGSENQANWTQCLRSGNKTQKIQFFNPIMQNKLHIRCLGKILSEYGNTNIYSYVVFSDRCELKSIKFTSYEHSVVYRRELKNIIPVRITNNKLAKDQIDSIYDRLYPFTQVSDDIKRQHIESIQTLHLSSSCENETGRMVHQTEVRYCPVCGNNMVEYQDCINEHEKRIVWKCTQYPKCQYTFVRKK